MHVPPEYRQVRPIIEQALREDLGAAGVDVTSELMIDPARLGMATLLQKQPGVFCGLPLVGWVCGLVDPALDLQAMPGSNLDTLEGRGSATACTALLHVIGPVSSLLMAERTLLNFAQRLSGIATLTRRYVDACHSTRAKIYDTRKTTPGLRLLEKYAVVVGGGCNHRMGLHDAVLIKDNHLAGIALPDLRPRLAEVAARARARGGVSFVEVEVSSLEQLREVLRVDGIDIVLLDNMDNAALRQAVALRDELAPQLELEASGGITLDTVQAVAQCGVDRISVGALTHSAPALDLSLKIAPGP